MSELTKKLLISKNEVPISIGIGQRTLFLVPTKKARSIVELLMEYKIDNIEDDKKLIPASDVFQHLEDKYGKSGTILRGFRTRDGLTQVALAKKLKIPQTDISQIENGKRTIGKKMAKRLEKIFKTDYRVFL